MKWEKIKFEKIVTLHRGYDLPVTKIEKGIYPVIFSNGRIEYHKEFKIKGPGIITGRSGSLGNVFYTENDFWPHNTTLYASDFHNNHPKFLFYYLKTLNLSNFNAGSGVPTLNRNHLKNLELCFPKDIKEQRAIAKILSDLDEKIELNNQMNKTLEAMAQTIFKHWFVDFESPNEKGKPYKSSGGKMVESELGRIPEGWKVARLCEFFQVRTGKKDANVASNDGKYPFFTCSRESTLCNEYSFDGSAILLAGNGDFNIKWYRGKFEAYQRTYVLMPYNHHLLGFLYHLMKYFLNDITMGHRGSVINFITKGTIEEYSFVCPPEDLLKEFGNKFEKINEQIEDNNEEIEILADIRDSLLPKLMSGKLMANQNIL